VPVLLRRFNGQRNGGGDGWGSFIMLIGRPKGRSMPGMPGMFEDMACRPVPVSEVVTGSTPVVAFGDPRNASVATLGINPSWHEFLAEDGSLLSGSKRRLATLTSLNAKDTALLDLVPGPHSF
jgi:hypothetical protein